FQAQLGAKGEGEGQEKEAGNEAAPQKDQEDRRVIDREPDADEAGAPGDDQCRLQKDEDGDRREGSSVARRCGGGVGHFMGFPVWVVTGVKTSERQGATYGAAASGNCSSMERAIFRAVFRRVSWPSSPARAIAPSSRKDRCWAVSSTRAS